VVKANENGDIVDEDKQKYVDVLVKDVKLKSNYTGPRSGPIRRSRSGLTDIS